MEVDALLQEARRRLHRVAPEELVAEIETGAIPVDIRREADRVAEGTLPGAIVIDRNVLEWRLDPSSSDRIPEAVDHHRRWILVCNEGFASSLAAASLHDLGLTRATDLIGGYRAWRRRKADKTPRG